MDNTANYQNNTQNFKFCRKCGRKLLADAEFCDSCGTRQISTETADSAETVSEPDVQYSNPQPVTPPPYTTEITRQSVMRECSILRKKARHR